MAKKTVSSSIKKIARDYRQLLEEKNIPVQKIILFGSQAKGTAKSDSDIDLCIVSPKFGRDRFAERVTLMKLAVKITPTIEPHPYNPADLVDKWDPLAAEIQKYGLTI